MNPRAWAVKRRKSYTVIGVQRKVCIRCGRRARYQWQVCADANNWRPLCRECDVELNAMVLIWMGCPEKLLAEYMLAYVKYVGG